MKLIERKKMENNSTLWKFNPTWDGGTATFLSNNWHGKEAHYWVSEISIPIARKDLANLIRKSRNAPK
jgi:hypothetical protein